MRLTLFLTAALVVFVHASAQANTGPGYFEAMMYYCYKGDLADRIGREPHSMSFVTSRAKRLAMEDLRSAASEGERAVTALCASSYYRAIKAGYVTELLATPTDAAADN